MFQIFETDFISLFWFWKYDELWKYYVLENGWNVVRAYRPRNVGTLLSKMIQIFKKQFYKCLEKSAKWPERLSDKLLFRKYDEIMMTNNDEIMFWELGETTTTTTTPATFSLYRPHESMLSRGQKWVRKFFS